MAVVRLVSPFKSTKKGNPKSKTDTSGCELQLIPMMLLPFLLGLDDPKSAPLFYTGQSNVRHSFSDMLANRPNQLVRICKTDPCQSKLDSASIALLRSHPNKSYWFGS